MSELKIISTIATIIGVGTISIFLTNSPDRDIKRAELNDLPSVKSEYRDSADIAKISEDELVYTVKKILTGNCFSLVNRSASCESEEKSLRVIAEFNKRNIDSKLDISHSMELKREITEILDYQANNLVNEIRQNRITLSDVSARYHELGVDNTSVLDKKLLEDYISNKSNYASIKSFKPELIANCAKFELTCKFVSNP